MQKYRVKRHAVIQPLDKPYRYIALTQGKNAIVDVEDFEWLSQWNWRATWQPHTKSFYACTWLQGMVYQMMHRMILSCDADEQCDHKDHDGLNNRRENLRKCTGSQNQHNRGKQKRNKSGFKGVSWSKERKCWLAQIGISGQQTYIGLFQTAEEAARAYDRSAKKLHGEFANLNFP